MIIWAVHAGIKGALVAIDNKKIVNVVRMPIIPYPTGKTIKSKINVNRLHDMLSRLPVPDKGIIEMPAVENANSRLILASKFQSAGIIEGAMIQFCPDIRFVTPRRWQAKYNLIKKSKWDSCEVANRIFPELKIEMVRDADIAEAALIGHWFLRYSGTYF